MGRFDQFIQKHQFPDQNFDQYDYGQTANATDQVVTSVKDIITTILKENVTSTTTSSPLLEISSGSDMVSIQETTTGSILDESQQSNRTMLDIGQNSTSFMEILENTTKNLNEMFATNNTISMETTPSTVTVLEEITGNNTGIVANTTVNTVDDRIVTTTENILSTIQSDFVTTDTNWNNTERNYDGLNAVEDQTLYIVIAIILAVALAVVVILILIYRKYRQSSSHSRQLYCVTNLQEISVSNDNCKPQYLHQN